MAKKSSHPNALLYQFQLANAKQKHLVKRTGHETILLAQPGPSALDDTSDATPKAQVINGAVSGPLCALVAPEGSHVKQIASFETASRAIVEEPSKEVVERGNCAQRVSHGPFEKEEEKGG